VSTYPFTWFAAVIISLMVKLVLELSVIGIFDVLHGLMVISGGSSLLVLYWLSALV